MRTGKLNIPALVPQHKMYLSDQVFYELSNWIPHRANEYIYKLYSKAHKEDNSKPTPLRKQNKELRIQYQRLVGFAAVTKHLEG